MKLAFIGALAVGDGHQVEVCDKNAAPGIGAVILCAKEAYGKAMK